MEVRKSRLFLAVPFTAGLLLAGQAAYAAPSPEPAPLQATQQTLTVRGTVSDNTGETLMGVAVTEEGNSKNVAVTDLDGNFTIRVHRGAVLKFSYVGYKSMTQTVTGTSMQVTMETDAQMLDEVIAIGYGTVRKADLAGSVSVLSDKAFEAQPITNVAETFQGRVAGVTVINDGIPGGSPRIRIRGTNSINKSNEPLYVVDGLVRESGLDGINTEDISSMQILKDASSTAIYGSRGANGVVIITTKKGKAGVTNVTLDVNLGWSKASHLPDILGTKEYAQGLVDYNGVDSAELADYLNGSNPGIDWKDEVFQTGMTQNYKLVVSKGGDNTQFFISGNYMKHEGIITDSQYERYAARVNVTSEIYSWLSATVDVNASHGIGKGIGGFVVGGYNPLWIAFNYSPSMNMYVDPDVANPIYARDQYGSIQESPMATIKGANERRKDVLNGHFDLRFKIMPGLTFTTSNGVDYYNYYGYGMSSSNRFEGASSSMNNNNTNRWFLQTSNNLTYNGTFNEKHHLTATGVWEATKSTSRGMGISGDNLIMESLGWYNVGATASRNATNSYSEWSLLSGVARVIYNFDNRYMLTGTFRADGSSKLTNKKWAYFPSIAGAWTISNESFMEGLNPTISNLKLRASWGIIGNQDIAPYSTLGMLSQTSTYYGNKTAVTGFWQNAVATPDLKWEKTNQVDVGIDAAFCNGRFDVSLDWYYKHTTDALLQVTAPSYLGGSRYYMNAGKVANTGVDIAINANIIEGRDLNWSSSINASYMKNEVKEMTTGEPILYSGSMQSIISDAAIVKEGEPIGTLYGYRWAGIDTDGYDTYYTAKGEVTRNPSVDDRVVLGKATPDFTLGWNNTINYKNWSFNAFFNGAFGAKRFNVLRYAMCSPIGNARAITSPDGISGIGVDMPDPRKTENNQYIGTSSKWLENANYFRLENLSVAYTLTKEVTRFADIRLSVSAQNLFTLTSYKGTNPAAYPFADASEWVQGVDMGTAPAPRTFSVGARFTF